VIDIIGKLVKIQEDKGLTNSQLADILGVSQSYISRLKNGLRDPGPEFLGSVMNVFPSMILDVVLYVKQLGTENNKEVINGIPSTRTTTSP
jgi:transcriptional regulator with XRE-family HTH domain